MGAQGQYVKSGGKSKGGQSLGRMNDNKNMAKLIKSAIGSCYICRSDFALDSPVGVGIRKIGKRYRKVAYHTNCDK